MDWLANAIEPPTSKTMRSREAHAARPTDPPRLASRWLPACPTLALGTIAPVIRTAALCERDGPGICDRLWQAAALYA